jgi:hypothetical protein
MIKWDMLTKTEVLLEVTPCLFTRHTASHLIRTVFSKTLSFILYSLHLCSYCMGKYTTVYSDAAFSSPRADLPKFQRTYLQACAPQMTEYHNVHAPFHELFCDHFSILIPNQALILSIGVLAIIICFVINHFFGPCSYPKENSRLLNSSLAKNGKHSLTHSLTHTKWALLLFVTVLSSAWARSATDYLPHASYVTWLPIFFSWATTKAVQPTVGMHSNGQYSISIPY